MNLRRLFTAVAVAAVASLAVAVPAQAHDEQPATAVQLDGWAAAAIHGHTYDCFGIAGINSACVDPTTGYGPVLWLCTGTNCSWSTGISAAGLYYSWDQPYGFARTGWTGQWETYTDAVIIGVSGYFSADASCNVYCAYATMPQSTFNSVIYISNSSGINYIHFVH